MNFKKVEAYTVARLAEYRDTYPEEITKDLKISADSGSFGACLLSIESPDSRAYSVHHRYVPNYAAIDALISDFVIRNYHLITDRAYQEKKKENARGMYCKLEIYNDNKLINIIEFKEAAAVKNELIKIIIAEKRRGVRTTWKPFPYSNDLRVIEKWTREEAHTTTNIKYIYNFKNIEY